MKSKNHVRHILLSSLCLGLFLASSASHATLGRSSGRTVIVTHHHQPAPTVVVTHHHHSDSDAVADAVVVGAAAGTSTGLCLASNKTDPQLDQLQGQVLEQLSEAFVASALANYRNQLGENASQFSDAELLIQMRNQQIAQQVD